MFVVNKANYRYKLLVEHINKFESIHNIKILIKHSYVLTIKYIKIK